MVTGLIRHEAKWTAPSPLWKSDLLAAMSTRNGSPWQPAILRFDNDLFMEETLSLLAYQPEQLMELLARPETWVKPMKRPSTISRSEAVEPISEFSTKIRRLADKRTISAGAPVKTDAAVGSTADGKTGDELPFKLYQPAHQRFYLVAASLVCQQAGMPDRRIDAGKREAAGFVIRRVAHTDANEEAKNAYDPTGEGWSEYAFMATAEGFAWKNIPAGERGQIQQGEERLPLFAMHFNDPHEHRRRMLAGLIPVGRREQYLSATEWTEPPAEDDDGAKQEQVLDAVKAFFDAQVLSPWQALIEQAKAAHENMVQGTAAGTDTEKIQKRAQTVLLLRETRERIQTGSWYILLDFARFLELYMDQVWKELTKATRDRELTTPEEDLVSQLKNTFISEELKKDLCKNPSLPPEVPSLAEALVKINATKAAEELEKADTSYREQSGPVSPWPGFLFPLADPGVRISDVDPWSVMSEPAFTGPLGISAAGAGWDALNEELGKIDIIGDLIKNAVSIGPTEPPELQSPQQPLEPANGWFVIRCVYERPNCGPLNPAVLSAPTEKFQMAPFFDPEAPARPVRISLPMDISPAGLRKYKKNATLMMSDMLCGKVGEIRKLTFGDIVLSVLPWPFHKDLPNPGKTGPCKKGTENAGMYCSLSIPIVTLVALILMIIIVSLFDMFFRWIPYLFTCFPIPGLKGKKA